VFAALLFACGDARAERLPIKSYTTADGMAHNAVNRIVRDSHGFLWFCTNDGLSRFDGYTFRNFGAGDGLPAAPTSPTRASTAGSISGSIRTEANGKGNASDSTCSRTCCGRCIHDREYLKRRRRFQRNVSEIVPR